jgi:hypothetical protein
MNATLYVPNQLPQKVPTDGLSLPSPAGYAQVSSEVAGFLGCAQGFVDILDCGPDYVAYSIFDYEGATNQPAMAALSAVSTHAYDAGDDDQVLQGPILLVTL